MIIQQDPGARTSNRHSPGSLAAAILAISKTDLVKAGLQASKRVTARYSWNSVFRTMFDIYRQIRI